jgi:hypothetical protein
MKFLPETGSELRASIKDDDLGNSMKTNYSRNVEICPLTHMIGGVDWQEMGDLRESVHDCPYGVMSPTRSGRTSDKVHSHFVPFPYRNLQGL